MGQSLRQTALRSLDGLSSDSDDKPIGLVIVAVEKKMATTKEKRVRLFEAINEEMEEDVAPLRRKSEKRKDTGTFESPEVIIAASPIEHLST